MKRLTAISLTAFALTLCFVGAASGASGSWGPWQKTYQGPITAPAGVVCSFAVTAEPVREDLRVRYHYNEAGAIDGYEATGPLIARITNTQTGESVTRNLSGLGRVTLNGDGSYDAVVNGGFLVFFLRVDVPAQQLLLLKGRTVLHGAPSGAKTLVATSGRSENLCETLA